MIALILVLLLAGLAAWLLYLSAQLLDEADEQVARRLSVDAGIRTRTLNTLRAMQQASRSTDPWSRR